MARPEVAFIAALLAAHCGLRAAGAEAPASQAPPVQPAPSPPPAPPPTAPPAPATTAAPQPIPARAVASPAPAAPTEAEHPCSGIFISNIGRRYPEREPWKIGSVWVFGAFEDKWSKMVSVDAAGHHVESRHTDVPLKLSMKPAEQVSLWDGAAPGGGYSSEVTKFCDAQGTVVRTVPVPAPTPPPPPLATVTPVLQTTAPTWTVAPSTGTQLPIPEVPADFQYVVHENKICAGQSFTDQKNIGCSGWHGISEVDCQKKCTENTAPRGAMGRCPAKTCFAVAFFPGSGWCHLFEAAQCRSLADESSVKTFAKTAKAGIWAPIEGGIAKVKKAMQTPVAQNVLKAGAAVAAAGVVAGGVAGAIETRKEQERLERQQQEQQARARLQQQQAIQAQAEAMARAVASTTLIPGDGIFLPQTTAAPGGSLSAPSSSSSGMPLWLPLLVIACCCCGLMLASFVLNRKRMRLSQFRARTASRDESFDEPEDEYEEGAAD